MWGGWKSSGRPFPGLTILWPDMCRFLLALCLTLAVLAPCLSAFAAEAPIESTAITEAVDSPGIDLPDVGPDYGPQVVELLTSINTYLTYLFCFTVLFSLVTAGKLVYSLFNMFF